MLASPLGQSAQSMARQPTSQQEAVCFPEPPSSLLCRITASSGLTGSTGLGRALGLEAGFDWLQEVTNFSRQEAIWFPIQTLVVNGLLV